MSFTNTSKQSLAENTTKDRAEDMECSPSEKRSLAPLLSSLPADPRAGPFDLRSNQMENHATTGGKLAETTAYQMLDEDAGCLTPRDAMLEGDGGKRKVISPLAPDLQQQVVTSTHASPDKKRATLDTVEEAMEEVQNAGAVVGGGDGAGPSKPVQKAFADENAGSIHGYFNLDEMKIPAYLRGTVEPFKGTKILCYDVNVSPSTLNAKNIELPVWFFLDKATSVPGSTHVVSIHVLDNVSGMEVEAISTTNKTIGIVAGGAVFALPFNHADLKGKQEDRFQSVSAEYVGCLLEALKVTRGDEIRFIRLYSGSKVAFLCFNKDSPSSPVQALTNGESTKQAKKLINASRIQEASGVESAIIPHLLDRFKSTKLEKPGAKIASLACLGTEVLGPAPASPSLKNW